MKLIIITLLLLTMDQAYCADISTLQGKTYTNITIIGQQPNAIKIMHEAGISTLYFTNLTLEIQKQYNYQPEKAIAFEEQEKQANAKIAEEEAAQKITRQQKRAQEEAQAAEYQKSHPTVTPEDLRALAEEVKLDEAIEITTIKPYVKTFDSKSNHAQMHNEHARTFGWTGDTDPWTKGAKKASELLKRRMESKYADWLNLLIDAADDVKHQKGEDLHLKLVELKKTLP